LPDNLNIPKVTIIVAVYNEAKYINAALESIFAQDYPREKFEIIIADGISRDGTRGIIERWIEIHPTIAITIIENPGKIVSKGLNLAINKAQGEVIVWMSAHCEHPKDYVRNVVMLRERENADNAGGVLFPVGKTYEQKAICAAYHSPIGVGGAMRGYKYLNEVQEVDAVYGGCWKRDRLIEIGLFDEKMIRNQDDELSFRLRSAGGRIIQSRAIQVKYYVRDSFPICTVWILEDFGDSLASQAD
jgi:succinoglycan biosynthesis protein ExoA